MNKKIFLIMILIIWLLSCWTTQKTNNIKNVKSNLSATWVISNTWEINPNNKIVITLSWSEKTLTWVTWEWSGIFEWPLKLVKDKELTIDDKIWFLKSEDEVKNILKNDNNKDYSEEIPRINSYYWKAPFYEFYILTSKKDKDIGQCNNIKTEEKKQLCNELYNANDETSIVNVYKKYWEDENFAKSMYTLFKNITSNNKDCLNENITLYLSCKKIFDKNFEVEDTYLKYNRIKLSNLFISKDYYKEISDYWKMDESFKKQLEDLFSTIKDQNNN